MSERIQPVAELTGRATSSTLNARSTMPEPQAPERPQTSEARRGREGAQPIGAEDMRISALADQMRELARTSPEMLGVFRQVVDEAEGRMGRDGDEQIEHMARRQGQLHTNGESVGLLSSETVSDIQIKRIIDTHNHDVTEGLMSENSQYALSKIENTIKDLTKRINDADFPQDQYDSAIAELDKLKQQELSLMKRESDPKHAHRNELYRKSEKFEKEFAVEIEQERVDEEIDPERRARFRSERQDLVKEIIEAIESAPSIEASRFDPIVMEMALKFRETRELLINEILFKPFEDKTEQGHYELNLYASGNLDELLAMLSRRGKDEKYQKDREIYQWYKAMRTTSRNFWEMNRGLWTGNLENFSRIAEEMNHDQFEAMLKIPGVGEVARLYDEKFWSIIARDGKITSENLVEAKERARETAIGMNNAGLLVSDYFEDREGTTATRRKLETWELERALNVGYVFFNITFRGAEMISMGQIQSGGGFQFASFPQEKAARIMNPLLLTGQRFEIAKERGGIDYLGRVKKNHQEMMALDGRHLGKNRFSQIGGAKVEDLELMALMGISGIFSSWRMTTAAYSAIRIDMDGQTTNLKEYWEDRKMTYGHGDKKIKVSGLGGYINDGIRKDAHLSLEQKQDAIVDILKPLIGEDGALNIGFGMLLRLGQGNTGIGGFLSGPEGFKAREMLWNRVAEKNPLMMINMLTNLVEKNGHESGFSLKNILKRNGWISSAQAEATNPSEPEFYLNTPKWKELRAKLELRQELTLKRQNNPDFEMISDLSLTEEEQALVSSIQHAGKEISADLADTVFPYMLFLNDMPYENFQWAKTGAQFFNRRLGDIGSYNKAGSAATGLLDNLGGMKPEDVIEKHFKEIERGIEGPNGAGFAFEAVMPFILAYIEMAETSAGVDQIGLIQEMKEFANKPTSILQEYAGTHAPSLSKKELYTFAHALHSAGVVGHHHVEELRKYKKFRFVDILISFLLNAAPVVGVELFLGTIKSSGSLR